MIASIEVWFDKSYKCWWVAPMNEENNQFDVARDFQKKSDAVAYAKTLMPTLIIETRN
jgi:hypothetical protein